MNGLKNTQKRANTNLDGFGYNKSTITMKNSVPPENLVPTDRFRLFFNEFMYVGVVNKEMSDCCSQ